MTQFLKTKDALESFMECLQCKKCKKLVSDPVRLTTCDHFFCSKCLPQRITSCLHCGVPIKPNDGQSDFVIQSLVKSCIDLFNLISEKKYDEKENEAERVKTPVLEEKENEKERVKTPILEVTENQKERVKTPVPTKPKRSVGKSSKTNKKKTDNSDDKSVSSIGNFSKLSTSKESLFTEPEDSMAIPKRVLQNLNKINPKGETVLHTACAKNNVKYAKALLDAGADPNTKDHAKLTPLQEAASYGFYEICEMLLQSGALPNTPGVHNQTPLHFAVISNQVREAELLIKHGASLRARDDHGKTPEDYCTSEEMRLVLTSTADMSDEISLHNNSLNMTIINSTTNSNRIIVYAVNLEKEKLELLRSVAAKHKFDVVTSFRKEVTHVVVKTNSEGSAELCYDLCLAILHGSWILTFDWVNFLDQDDNSDIEFNIFEVQMIGHSFETPRKARESAQNKNPGLFNNCIFHFAIKDRTTCYVGNMELTKEQLINLALAGEGQILKRQPRPGDITDTDIVPFHVSEKPDHPLHKCSHYIIYNPGKDEPKMPKYRFDTMKALPLLWFIESIEKFQLMDPVNYGM